MPRISIMIPTYNCGRFLGRAIDTALAQSYTDFEILVIDDGSTDNTRDVVARYGNKVRYFHQPNRGLSSARNLALSRATGEFVAYLDADDMWYPQKLEAQIAFLDAHKECGLVHSEVSVIDEDDKILHLRFNQETGRSFPHGYCLIDLLRRCHIQILTVLERRECLDRAGIFDERLAIAQDYHHWIKVALQGFAIGYLPEPLGKYRWRRGSLMSSQRRLLGDFTKIYEILQNEHRLEETHGVEIQRLVASQLYANQRQLAYLERLECSGTEARRRLWHLVRQWPFRLELYIDLAKSYIKHRKLQTPTNPS